jgi:hypothetical protein
LIFLPSVIDEFIYLQT